MSEPVACTSILADIANPAVHARIHILESHDAVEIVRLGRGDLSRHRLRTATNKGTECAIALPRHEHLFDGAVLFLDEVRAIVVRAEPEQWLAFRAANPAAGLELGYFAGNMHWPVRFEGDQLYVAGGAGAQQIMERLRHLLNRGGITFEGDAT
jgi:urease accessory protein